MFNAKFSGGANFTAKISGGGNFSAKLSETILKPVGDYYTGAYEWTPGEDEQTIPIAGMVATRDIKISPVPSNYGRLSYSGGILKVW